MANHRNVKDGSQFTAPIMKAAKKHAIKATGGVCPCCKSEYVTGGAGNIDHKLAFKLRQFIGACGLVFVGQRDNAILICSKCNDEKGKKEQRICEMVKRGEHVEAEAAAVALFKWIDAKQDVTMGKVALKNRKKSLRAIEDSTVDKKAATAALTAAKKGDDEKAIIRAAKKEFQIAHRRANQRRAARNRKQVVFS